VAGENVEKVDRIYEVLFANREVGPDLLAEDVEWVNPRDAVERGIRRGIEGFSEAIRSVFDAWEEVRFETERVIDCGAEVIALGRLGGRGRGTGIEVAQPHGQVWTFRDGRVTRMSWFNSHSEALEAAGLRE
jgi:ketosteroid isomerase-like protein